MKRILALVSLWAALVVTPAFAQSTATPVVTGYLTTSGCPSGQTSCFVQYGSGAPPPSGTQDTNLKQVNGATVNVGTGAAGTGTQRVTTSTDSTIATITNAVTVTQPTAASLNATVVGTGTLAVQNTAAIPAGSALIGKVGVDQTTPGTTNAVSIAQIGATTAVTGGLAGTLGIGGTSATAATDDSSNPIKIGCLYFNTTPAVTNGQRAALQCSNAGGLGIALLNGTTWTSAVSIIGAVAAGNAGTGTVAVEEAGRKFNNITTATTTTVKSGAGFLHTMCINTDAASATITAYDNTAGSGTKIFTVTNPLTLLSMGPICATYDLEFGTGLTVVTTGVQDITMTYR